MSDIIPQDDPLKQCKACEKFFPIASFSKDKSKKDGLCVICKTCAKERTRAWKETRKEEISKKGKLYYQSNKEEMGKKHKAYFLAHIEHQRDYLRQYHLDHREESLERTRQYRKTEKGRIVRRAELHKRRLRNRSIPGTLTSTQIQAKLKAQHYRCYYAACGFAKFEKKNGKYIFHLEHTIPTSRTEYSPRHDINYVVLSCPDCNLKKSNKLPSEFFEGGRLF